MPSNDDDDTIIKGSKKGKFVAEAEEVGKKPVTLRLWVVVAFALAAFALGAWLL